MHRRFYLIKKRKMHHLNHLRHKLKVVRFKVHRKHYSKIYKRIHKRKFGVKRFHVRCSTIRSKLHKLRLKKKRTKKKIN